MLLNQYHNIIERYINNQYNNTIEQLIEKIKNRNN